MAKAIQCDMKHSVILFSVLISCLFLEACVKVLDVDIDERDEKLVVEGLVTNQNEPYTVRLSKTLVVHKGSDFPKVSNAVVVISDDAGNRDTLVLAEEGLYTTSGPRQGVVGRTYHLSVEVDGKMYTAQDRLESLSPIDSFYTVYIPGGSRPGFSEDGHYAFFNTTDPPQEKNYYMYHLYKNKESVLSINRIAVFDDRFLAPVIIGSRLPGRYESGDTLLLQFYSLSEKAYLYYDGIAQQLQNDGGFFSTPPANAPTNMTGGALGFFQASSLEVDSLLVP
jgi:hypothetical protein